MTARGVESPFAEWRKRWAERELPDDWYQVTVTTRVPCGDWFERRDAALIAHATQVDPEGMWFKIPLELQREVWPTEDFELARSFVDTPQPGGRPVRRRARPGAGMSVLAAGSSLSPAASRLRPAWPTTPTPVTRRTRRGRSRSSSSRALRRLLLAVPVDEQAPAPRPRGLPRGPVRPAGRDAGRPGSASPQPRPVSRRRPWGRAAGSRRPRPPAWPTAVPGRPRSPAPGRTTPPTGDTGAGLDRHGAPAAASVESGGSRTVRGAQRRSSRHGAVPDHPDPRAQRRLRRRPDRAGVRPRRRRALGRGTA